MWYYCDEGIFDLGEIKIAEKDRKNIFRMRNVSILKYKYKGVYNATPRNINIFHRRITRLTWLWVDTENIFSVIRDIFAH